MRVGHILGGYRESDDEIGLQHTTTPDVIASFWQYRRMFPDTPVYPVDMSFYKHIMTEKDTGSSRPSNGFLGMHLALMICDLVEVYGFMRNWKAARVKYHYFNDEVWRAGGIASIHLRRATQALAL